MKWLIFIIVIFVAHVAHAGCYADYKAKQENPLKLHYGIMKLGDGKCSASATEETVAARLLPHGWILLNLVTGCRELPALQQKENAGENFLRY